MRKELIALNKISNSRTAAEYLVNDIVAGKYNDVLGNSIFEQFCEFKKRRGKYEVFDIECNDFISQFVRKYHEDINNKTSDEKANELRYRLLFVSGNINLNKFVCLMHKNAYADKWFNPDDYFLFDETITGKSARNLYLMYDIANERYWMVMREPEIIGEVKKLLKDFESGEYTSEQFVNMCEEKKKWLLDWLMEHYGGMEKCRTHINFLLPELVERLNGERII